MTKEEIISTIDKLIPELSGIEFALLGTCGLYLQGITSLVPKDFDILTNDNGIHLASEKFGSELFSGEDSKYLETEFHLNGIEIHFVSTDKNPVRPDNCLPLVETVNFEGRKIPCMSLTSEYEAYSQMGRDKDKAKLSLIRAALEKRVETV